MQRQTLVATLLAVVSLSAQPPAQTPAVTSPEVTPERHIMFRIFAPHAQKISVFSTDLFGLNLRHDMAKRDDGVWEVDAGPIDPGAYRYNFDVDGVSVMDPRSASVSESNGNAWSMVYVPGADFMETKEVPHGAVSSVTYYSKSLGKFRRMHVYTPPGYETSSQKYPIFYLLHGAGDCDDSWTSVGRAGFIIDNLIAAGKAKPMVIVMPAGHTSTQPLRGLDFNDEFAVWSSMKQGGAWLVAGAHRAPYGGRNSLEAIGETCARSLPQRPPESAQTEALQLTVDTEIGAGVVACLHDNRI